VCGSSNRKYEDLKKSAFYTSKYLGAWYGNKVDILGDYDEEHESRKVRDNYKDISIEVIAMLIELGTREVNEMFDDTRSGENHWLGLFPNLLNLEFPPGRLTHELQEAFGRNYMNELYKRIHQK
jgi:hypothetical protein